jgi:hypothetical protein
VQHPTHDLTTYSTKVTTSLAANKKYQTFSSIL